MTCIKNSQQNFALFLNTAAPSQALLACRGTGQPPKDRKDRPTVLCFCKTRCSMNHTPALGFTVWSRVPETRLASPA